MIAVERPAPPEGYGRALDWYPAPAIGWIVPPIGAGRCRWTAGQYPRRACGRPPVASLMRGFARPAPWDYCELHLYGHWIEAGQVMTWRAKA